MVKALWFGFLWMGLLGCASATRAPILLAAEGPIYPEYARVQQIEGFVTLAYDLTPSGNVVNVRVIKAVPAGVFDDAAVNAVRAWRFLPMQHKGQPTAALQQTSTLTFKLSEDQRNLVSPMQNDRAN